MGVAYEREAGGAHVAEAYGQNGRRARGRRFCSKGICHYEKRFLFIALATLFFSTMEIALKKLPDCLILSS